MERGDVINLFGIPCECMLCITCGVAFTVPKIIIDEHRRKGGFHYCPNGHGQGWDEEGSEFERLRRERDRLKQQTARLEEERDHAQREAIDQRERAVKSEAKAKRLTKRAAAGTCPCCKRTFKELSEHMKHQHPEFVKETGANVVALRAKG